MWYKYISATENQQGWKESSKLLQTLQGNKIPTRTLSRSCTLASPTAIQAQAGIVAYVHDTEF